MVGPCCLCKGDIKLCVELNKKTTKEHSIFLIQKVFYLLVSFIFFSCTLFRCVYDVVDDRN